MDRKTAVQKNEKRVALFFTYGVSLDLWEKKGMLERELALYKRLAERGYRFSFFTYGADDHRFADQLRAHNIDVYEKQHKMPTLLYSFLLPFCYKKELQRCDVMKTNQMHGSWAAVIAKWVVRKPLIVRTGYMLSTFARRRSWARYVVASMVERFVCHFANAIVVATETDSACLRCCAERVEIIPNYVDTKKFVEIVHQPTEGITRLLFVGRLEPQKNVCTLINAVHDLENVSLTVVGNGSQRAQLEALAARSGSDIHFVGQLPQEQVREYFAQTDIFVLPSLYEGLPKILLEAMATGLPIVTTNVLGINTVVTHEQTAIVVEPTKEGLRQGIETLQNDPILAKKIGCAAQEEAKQFYSLDTIINQEISLYEAVS